MVVKPCSSFFCHISKMQKNKPQQITKQQASANNKTTGLNRLQIIMSRHALSASILMSLKHKKQPYKGKHKQTSTKESRLNV